MTGSGRCWQHGGMRPTAYRRNARGLRDRQAFEGVRMQAGALFAAGHTQAQVARTLGVARQNISRWHAQWREGGLQALRSAGPTGYAPRLSDQQLAAIDQALRPGATAPACTPGSSALPAAPSSVTSGRLPAGWPRTGPRIRRNARRRRAAIVFWDESGASLLPVTRRTWAPRGRTPVICHHFKWKRVSMAAGLCYGSRGGGAGVALPPPAWAPATH